MIYLDIDGVMLSGADYMATPVAFPANRVDLINQLLDYTDSSIVLSSTWRRGDSGRNMLQQSGLWKRTAHQTADGQVCHWRTPFLDDKDIDDGFGNVPAPKFDPNLSLRGQEIQAHLDQYDIGRHIILDDDTVLVGQFHIAINQYDGLTQDDIDCAKHLWDAQLSMPRRS